MKQQQNRVQVAKNILLCLHLQISTDFDGKPSCLECGLVQEQVSRWGYCRSITHYKQLLNEGKEVPPISSLVGKTLKQQVIKFKERQQPKQQTTSIPSHSLNTNKNLLQDYINFLRNNQGLVLPKKERKRELLNIYGEHRKIVLEFIARIQLAFSSPPQ